MNDRLPWQRTFEPEHEDFVAFAADGISYARVFFNITATKAAYRYSWAVSIKYQFNETGSAEHLREAVDQATASYWRRTAIAEAWIEARKQPPTQGHPETDLGSD